MKGPVLIFDSGVGGLSVAQSLRQHYPEAALCYACDNAWLPYGLREDAALTDRIVAVCRAAVAACQPSVLVVACNTASTLALENLRERLAIPVVGTVPAIKPAAAISRTRHIGLLATKATVGRPYTQRLIDSFANDCVITRVAADALVVEAEAYLAGATPNIDRMQAALAPLWHAVAPSSPVYSLSAGCRTLDTPGLDTPELDTPELDTPDLDTVVLGCTHFPLLKPWLTQLAPVPLHWIDSGDAIARRVAQVVDELNSEQQDGRCYTTASAANLTAGLARYGFNAPQLLNVGA
ncbi:glutamate racemase [Vreelandella boliviensis]|uniref:Glutamate racemase n=1 Tax=Vreelandella boliviensis LC1 TaxID=1072583 RepID=A0A265DWP5_9GAMM|nr:aspartate/glutamate racemase family protein [Halomonas boliviensis]EHJ93125.1 Glutamate racemase [Halomonas boliviensis LC1]OZT73737.1 glutamate racemase [Halomonas boliviensis LC1]